MTTNTMKKAAGATNSNGPHSDTNGANFPTDGVINQALESMPIAVPSISLSPPSATIPEALWVLFHPAGVFSVQSLITKQPSNAETAGTAK